MKHAGLSRYFLLSRRGLQKINSFSCGGPRCVMLKAWRAHQAEVRRRAEAGEPPLKTIEDFRVEIPDWVPDDEPEPNSAESEVQVRSVQNVRTYDAAQGTGVESAAGEEERAAKVPRVE